MLDQKEDMLMETIKYPIGIQTFRKIIEGNYIYIDKTGIIYDLIDKYKYVFLSRPRRFGKSLLSSTIHSYLAGEKELFEGLKIAELEKDWACHPVFHFDMSTAKHMDDEQLLSELNIKLSGYEEIYGRVSDEEYINQRLNGLVQRAFQQTGQKAVIIIDEYDAPLLDVLNDSRRLRSMRQIMRNFYSPIKSLDPYLNFVFITGINKFSQLNIFSELNNLMNISMVPKYSTICGISQTELETQLQRPVEELAGALDITYEEAIEKLKENYDGYHFCKDSEDIYNPFSLLKALSLKEFGSYWFDTATPTYLLERLDRNPIDETILDRMTEIALEEFDVSPEVTDNPLPLLYQTGYITIKSYDKELEAYTLGYPNNEVRNGFLKSLLARYRSSDPTGASFVLKFSASMKRGNINEALERMQAYLAGMPNDLENKSEKHFQTIIYLIFSLLGYYMESEVKSAVGRADAVCKTKDRIYVFEFKVDKSAEEALQQIDDKGYLIPYKFDGREVVKVGVNISTESRTLDGWIIS